MINYFALSMVLGFSAVFSFFIYERVMFATGKKMLIEKLIDFLDEIHRRTEPRNKIEKDVRTYHLTERVNVTRVYFDGKN